MLKCFLVGFVRAFGWSLCAFWCLASLGIAQSNLLKIENCRLIETDWADGDSFLVADAEGKSFTIRLYGADCLESHVNDTTDARRLRAQRRYFGISNYGGSSSTSIRLAKQLGDQAGDFVVEALQEPFTVVTAFADARGDGKYKRYYGFIITAAGDDLSQLLVRAGLARAFGVYRSTIDGQSQSEYRETLRDAELQAASRGAGAWGKTDWNALPEERREAREEIAELELATGKNPLEQGNKISLNSAPRDELMRLPGIGESFANRIIEGRPFDSVDQLMKVNGIGPKKLAKIRPYLTVNE